MPFKLLHSPLLLYLYPPHCQDEIFDLFLDPYETTNLAGMPEYSEVEVFLIRTISKWVDASYPELEYPTLVERTAELLHVRIVCNVYFSEPWIMLRRSLPRIFT